MSFIQIGSDQTISPIPQPLDGQVPTWNSSTGLYEAETPAGGNGGTTLPPQAGNAGRALTTDGTNLVWVLPALYAWTLTGNTDTNPAVQFLGTTDAQPVVFRVNNAEVMRFDASAIKPTVNTMVFTSATEAKVVQPIDVDSIDGLPFIVKGGSASGANDLSPGGLVLSSGGGTGTLGTANKGIDFLAPVPTTTGNTVRSPIGIFSMRFTSANTGGELTLPAITGTSALMPGTPFTLQPAQGSASSAGKAVTISGGNSGAGSDLAPGGLLLSAGQGTGTLGTNPGISFLAQTIGGSGTNIQVLSQLARMRFTGVYPGGEFIFNSGGGSGILSAGNLEVSGALDTNIGYSSLGVNVRPASGGSALVSGNGSGSTSIGTLGGAVLVQPAGSASAGTVNTIKGGNAGGTNQAGGSLVLSAGNNTGNNGNTLISFRVPTIGASGSTPNTAVERMTLSLSNTFPGGILNFTGTGSTSINATGGLQVQASGGVLLCQSAGANNATFSSSGSGVTSLGTNGTGSITIGRASATTTLAGFNKQANMGYLLVRLASQQVVAAGATATIAFGDTVSNTNMTFSAGVITFPRVGRYLINASITISGTGLNAGTFYELRSTGTSANSSRELCQSYFNSATTSLRETRTVSQVVVTTAANQTLALQLVNSTNVSISANGNATTLANETASWLEAIEIG